MLFDWSEEIQFTNLRMRKPGAVSDPEIRQLLVE